MLINEFPDLEADRNGGRKTTPVLKGLDFSARFYSIATMATYVWIVGCVIATMVSGAVVMPVYTLISLLALPPAIKAMRGAKEYADREKLIAAMGDNVKFILLCQVLIGVGYILEKLFPLA